MRRGGPHRSLVQRRMEPTDLSRSEGRPDRPVEQDITVGPSACAVARAELRIDPVRPEYGERFRQQRVYPAYPRGVGTLGVGVEVDDLLASMNTAVGPARASESHRRPGDGGNSRLEGVLDR